MTHRIIAAAALAASLSLAACNSEPETIVSNSPDPQAEALKNAPPVELPPAIQTSRTYRCADNALIYADFYTNDTVRVRLGSRDAQPTTLTREGEDGPYAGEGWSVAANAPETTISAPGHGSQGCHE